jgi:hypothetical protein
VKIWQSPDFDENFSKSLEPVAIFNFLTLCLMGTEINLHMLVFHHKNYQDVQKCIVMLSTRGTAEKESEEEIKNPRRSHPRPWHHPSDALNRLSKASKRT